VFADGCLVLLPHAERCGLNVIGTTERCRDEFYAITAERRITHPAVAVITEHAKSFMAG
jgi:LysR family transcriptional activator of nhaA